MYFRACYLTLLKGRIFTLNELYSKAMANKPATELIKQHEKLIWIDLEMTGLDRPIDKIMEAAVVITNSDLEDIIKGPDLIIHVDDDTLDTMNDWCRNQHGKSGLTEACRKSTITIQEAENKLLKFVSEYSDKGKCPLAGNSIYSDKKFLEKYMPNLYSYLHYRIIDVSSIKELCRRWYPEDYKNAPKKSLSHRALEDILESIQELKYYRKTIFLPIL